MTRFVDDTFDPMFFSTIGVDFKVRTLMIDGHQCKVQIWLVPSPFGHRMCARSVDLYSGSTFTFRVLVRFRDTAGQERFRVITTTVK